jgi:hypothetical protein
MGAIQWPVACLLLIAAMSVYFPLIFIRKVNRVLATLERIEANTRSRAAGAAV